MNNLIEVLDIAVKNKPSFGDACNNCGYCCLVEICCIGQDLTGSYTAPCKLLVSKDNKHYCKLADNGKTKTLLGIGSGCCSETQREVINRLNRG